MNKTSEIERYRLFLIEKLPEPLSPASRHLQIFDNYIFDTRIRIRKIRDPETTVWAYLIQQILTYGEEPSNVRRLAEIHLNEAEYAVFQRFEGFEIRKNRYFHDFGLFGIAFDIYLGDLKGLATARVDFRSDLERDNFEVPSFAVFEITSEPFFNGRNLVGKRYGEVSAEVYRIAAEIPRLAAASNE